MDEAWDSEHNKQLLATVPVQFMSLTEPLPAGHTRIVGFKGKDGMFPGDEKLGLRHITDGTSNTVFFVEASPEAAVEWTRPADIDFDPAKPFAGLAQPSGEFFAAFVDGSVRRLSLGIRDAVMKAIITRAGGEVVQYDDLSALPAPGIYEQLHAPAGVHVPVEIETPAVNVEPAIDGGREPDPGDIPPVDGVPAPAGEPGQ
jgi:hypothetical protein